MGGDHGHHHKIVIPDYKIYKVEDVPELVRVQEVLARSGLKDPWLRNEVWKYSPEFGGNPRQRFIALISRGFKYGFGLFALSIVGEKVYGMMKPPEHGHGHH